MCYPSSKLHVHWLTTVLAQCGSCFLLRSLYYFWQISPCLHQSSFGYACGSLQTCLQSDASHVFNQHNSVLNYSCKSFSGCADKPGPKKNPKPQTSVL
uniref:Uncharacterized protein n=1 Tax=Dromaius novaehollandiae TaxID=8790 RepID=A0A8C4JRP5_DRONO